MAIVAALLASRHRVIFFAVSVELALAAGCMIVRLGEGIQFGGGIVAVVRMLWGFLEGLATLGRRCLTQERDAVSLVSASKFWTQK